MLLLDKQTQYVDSGKVDKIIAFYRLNWTHYLG